VGRITQPGGPRVGDPSCRCIRERHLPQDCRLISAAIGPSGRWGRSISQTACSPPCGYSGSVLGPVPPRSGTLASLPPPPGQLQQYQPNGNKIATQTEHGLKLFENGLLSIMCEPKWEEAGLTGGWRKLSKGELHSLYSSPNTMALIKWKRVGLAKHLTIVGEYEGKRQLGGPRRRWVLLRRIRWYGLDSSGSAQGTMAGSCERGNLSWGSTKSG
jgi:hypothetical protein